MKQYKVKKLMNEAKKLNVTDAYLTETLASFSNMSPKDRQQYALGAGLYKLRLATHEGKGKSGGSRTILAFKEAHRTVWLHIFPKNDKENISATELKKLKVLSGIFMSMSAEEITRLINNHELYEVNEHV